MDFHGFLSISVPKSVFGLLGLLKNNIIQHFGVNQDCLDIMRYQCDSTLMVAQIFLHKKDSQKRTVMIRNDKKRNRSLQAKEWSFFASSMLKIQINGQRSMMAKGQDSLVRPCFSVEDLSTGCSERSQANDQGFVWKGAGKSRKIGDQRRLSRSQELQQLNQYVPFQKQAMKESNQSECTQACEAQDAGFQKKSPKKIAKYRKQFLSRAFFKLELMSSKSRSFQQTVGEQSPLLQNNSHEFHLDYFSFDGLDQ